MQSLEPNGPLSRLTRSLGPAPAWAQEAETERTPRKLRPHEQKRAKLALNQKMSKVPVFLVTNENGAPFLNELPSGDYSALMFLFPAEAKKNARQCAESAERCVLRRPADTDKLAP